MQSQNYILTRDAINEVIRARIADAGNRIGSVVFIKKDGSVRRLQYQLAAMKNNVKGTERGKMSSATRAINHPNLMTVWDIKKRAFRSVNLDTVLTVARNGRILRFRELVERRSWITTHDAPSARN